MAEAVVLVAAGSSSRFGDLDKLWVEVGGRPLLDHVLVRLVQAQRFDRLVVVTRAERVEATRMLVDRQRTFPPSSVIVGGAARHDSERRGIESLAPDIDSGLIRHVAVHDAARPFPTVDLVSAVMDAAGRHGGAVPALAPVRPLLRWVGEEWRALDDRTTRRMQTPQAFLASPLLEAYRAADLEDYAGPDTASCVARFSDLPIAAVPGHPDNIKITYPSDLTRAEQILSQRERR